MRLWGRVVAEEFAHEDASWVNSTSIAIDGEMVRSLL